MPERMANHAYLMRPARIWGQDRRTVTVPRPRDDMSDLLPSAAAEWLGQPIPVWANPSLIGQADYYWGGPSSWIIVSRRFLEVVDLSTYQTFALALHEYPGWRGKRGEPYGHQFAPSAPRKVTPFSIGELWVAEIPWIDILDPMLSKYTRKSGVDWPACVLGVDEYVFRRAPEDVPAMFRLLAGGQFEEEPSLTIASSDYPWVAGLARLRMEKAELRVDWWNGFEASFVATE